MTTQIKMLATIAAVVAALLSASVMADTRPVMWDGIADLGKRVKAVNPPTTGNPFLTCRSIDPTFKPRVDVAVIRQIPADPRLLPIYRVAIRMNTSVLKKTATGAGSPQELDLQFADNTGTLRGKQMSNGAFPAELRLDSNRPIELSCKPYVSTYQTGAFDLFPQWDHIPSACDVGTRLNLDHAELKGNVAFVEEFMVGGDRAICQTYYPPNPRFYTLDIAQDLCGTNYYTGVALRHDGVYKIKITDHRNRTCTEGAIPSQMIVLEETLPNGNSRVVYGPWQLNR